MRQGGVLSPYLFAIGIDQIVEIIQTSGFGCHVKFFPLCIFLYADDIILLSPSVTGLQEMIRLCETFLLHIDMALNAKKSVCIRFGPHFNNVCCSLCTLSGDTLTWVDSCRYLGVFLVAATKFKCLWDNNKKSFYRAFNGIYGKVGRYASEEVIIKLINAKCVPVLLYGMDACPLLVSDSRSVDFIVNRIFMKIFKTNHINIVKECQLMFGFELISHAVVKRKLNFLNRFIASENIICNVLRSFALDDIIALNLPC